MVLKNGLLIADVVHKRLIPSENQFRYSVYYLAFPIHLLASLKTLILSINRFNFLSFYERDHKTEAGKLEHWIRDILAEYKIKEADGDIVLVTMPRVLGHIFNPVSFWFCLDKAGGLRAVLSEVNNTFRESHNYLVAHPDHRIISPDEWMDASKVFYVSPFLEVKGFYQFRFYYSQEKIGVWINYFTEEGETLQTSVIGKRVDLKTLSSLKVFFYFPFVTLKVITLIHYQAIKLWLKRIRYVTRPTPPKEKTTRWP